MQGKARLQVERRARTERTLNMFIMPVTLDVSRFSGWLKADASCRVKKGAYKPRYMRLEVYARKALGAATAQEVLCAWKGLDYRDWAQDTHVAHPKHAAHSCDIGRVET